MYEHFKDAEHDMAQPSFIDNFSQQFTLAPERTALLIIDMQNATGNREMGLGKLSRSKVTVRQLNTDSIAVKI